jgi:hypothetical protein
MEETMTKQMAAIIAFAVAFIATAGIGAHFAKRGNSDEDSLRLQTRQDVAGLLVAQIIGNGLLAAILVALLF